MFKTTFEQNTLHDKEENKCTKEKEDKRNVWKVKLVYYNCRKAINVASTIK